METRLATRSGWPLALAALIGFAGAGAPQAIRADTSGSASVGSWSEQAEALANGLERERHAVQLAQTSQDLSSSQAARFEIRIDELERQLRSLTGQIEETQFSLRRLEREIQLLGDDVDFRFERIEGGGSTSSAAPAASTADRGSQSASSAEVAGRAPRVIGSVDPKAVEEVRQQSAASQSAALPGGSPKADYDYAFGLLRQADFAAAEQAFSRFLQVHPDDPLAGNAKYWLGETYYVRGRYQEAAVTFGEGFQEYPQSPKAPDNLLKLGKSLSELGQTQDACRTLAELLNNFSGASATVLQQARVERQRLRC